MKLAEVKIHKLINEQIWSALSDNIWDNCRTEINYLIRKRDSNQLNLIERQIYQSSSRVRYHVGNFIYKHTS